MLNQAVRHAANQAQQVSSVVAFNLATIYDGLSRSLYHPEDRQRRQRTSIAYLARYCELERQYFTERGVL